MLLYLQEELQKLLKMMKIKRIVKMDAILLILCYNYLNSIRGGFYGRFGKGNGKSRNR